MREGSVPPSISRITRSTSTWVLPEPALALTQTVADGSEALSCARLAGGFMAHAHVSRQRPFAEAREMIVVALVLVLLHHGARVIGLLGAGIGGEQLLQFREMLLRRAP